MRKHTLTTVCLFVTLAMVLPVQAAVTIKNLRLWRAPDHTRLVFDLSGSARYEVQTLSNPARVVIDLPGAKLQGKLPRVDYNGRFLKGVRSGSPSPGVLRIVLDLKRRATPRATVFRPNRLYGYRLAIDLHAYRPVTKRPKKTAPPKRRSQPRKPRSHVIVAIDAGHGGEDPGAVGRRKTKEKYVTLQVARELKKLVDRDPVLRAVMVRNSDYYVSLRRRTAIARRHQADLFISIHADAFPKQRSVRGSSVYALSQRGASSEGARWLADKENAADLVGGVSLRDKDDLLAKVLLDLSMTKTISDSLELGNDVLRALGRLGKLRRRHVEQAGFVVLKSPDVPSILVETAFISNPKEERLLRNAKHRRRIALAIYNGIKRYASRRPIHKVALPTTNYRVKRGDSLSVIAQRHGTTVAALKRLNQLNSNRLQIGQRLRVPDREG